MKIPRSMIHLLSALCLFGISPTDRSRAQSLTILGSLQGDSGNSYANGISGDGLTVVGESYALGSSQAFRWTQHKGMTGLGFAGSGNHSQAFAASYDGSVVVGSSSEQLTNGIIQNQQGFRWTSSGMVGIGIPNGALATQARSVSADGSVIAGSIDFPWDPPNPLSEAMRWTSANGIEGLGHIELAGFYSGATGISADGSVVVGVNQSMEYPGVAMRWSAQNGMQGLGTLPSFNSSFAQGVSGDGRVVVGHATKFGPDQEAAVRWTAEVGLAALLETPPPDGPSGGRFVSWANAASHDGEVIVGTMGYRHPNPSLESRQAFIWNQVDGVRTLESILTDAGVDLDGWLLEWGNGVSADGMIVVGNARKSVGSGFLHRGFVADLRAVPEPSSTLYFTFAGTLMLFRRSRR
jgi:uncharacterized membrane protein